MSMIIRSVFLSLLLTLTGCLTADIKNRPAFAEIVDQTLYTQRPCELRKDIIRGYYFGGEKEIYWLSGGVGPDGYGEESLNKGESSIVPTGTPLWIDKIERRSGIDSYDDIYVFGRIIHPETQERVLFAFDFDFDYDHKGHSYTIRRAPWDNDDIPLRRDPN